MDWNFAVSEKKKAELREKIERLGIDLSLIEEQFIHGGGKGGQKINKTASCVRMSYPPLGIQVRSQATRQRSMNRFLALRELVEQIEAQLSPDTSERVAEVERIRKRKQRAKRRSRSRLEQDAPSGEGSPDGGSSEADLD